MPKKQNGKLFVHEFRERLRPHLEAHFDDMREVLENQEINLEKFIELCAKGDQSRNRWLLRAADALADEAKRPPVVIVIESYRATILNLPSALAYCYKRANKAA